MRTHCFSPEWKTRLAGLLMLAVLFLPGLAVQGRMAPNGKPYNFLVILADDLGAAELSSYGNPIHRTPHLDRLAAEGMQFRTCYATPICSPSRVLLMTGRYGFRTGWYHLMNQPGSPTHSNPEYDLGSAEVTFADLLKEQGYTTALAGKWQLTGRIPRLVHDCGFDTYRIWAYKEYLPPGVEHQGAWEVPHRPSRFWHPSLMENGKYLPTEPNDYGPDLLNQFLIEFIRSHRDRPFCAYYPALQTHEPWDPVPDPGQPGKRRPGGLKANLEYLDFLVGQLTRAIDDAGLKENTIILFTGDNGTGKNGKATVTELGARVPLIVRCPGTIPPGVISDALVDLSDILPTVADFAGARLPAGRTIDGKSLYPVLRGEQQEHREWIFSYLGAGRVLRDRRWLLEEERFFDCGPHRDGVEQYREVTDSEDPEVRSARDRFKAILAQLPAGPAPAQDVPRNRKDGKPRDR